eukprot:TRINITY_DN18412_c0_g1_i1.p1 TRINITY_DN18412_c0_g1~~TRINITY_DN18412_c0_g1_i1.p1  ORF type:complete len:600 (+),score=67.10 TRINITY_DN18412_c0_g1_i1:67-1866(+)
MAYPREMAAPADQLAQLGIAFDFDFIPPPTAPPLVHAETRCHTLRLRRGAARQLLLHVCTDGLVRLLEAGKESLLLLTRAINLILQKTTIRTKSLRETCQRLAGRSADESGSLEILLRSFGPPDRISMGSVEALVDPLQTFARLVQLTGDETRAGGMTMTRAERLALQALGPLLTTMTSGFMAHHLSNSPMETTDPVLPVRRYAAAVQALNNAVANTDEWLVKATDQAERVDLKRIELVRSSLYVLLELQQTRVSEEQQHMDTILQLAAEVGPCEDHVRFADVVCQSARSAAAFFTAAGLSPTVLWHQHFAEPYAVFAESHNDKKCRSPSSTRSAESPRPLSPFSLQKPTNERRASLTLPPVPANVQPQPRAPSPTVRSRTASPLAWQPPPQTPVPALLAELPPLGYTSFDVAAEVHAVGLLCLWVETLDAWRWHAAVVSAEGSLFLFEDCSTNDLPSDEGYVEYNGVADDPLWVAEQYEQPAARCRLRRCNMSVGSDHNGLGLVLVERAGGLAHTVTCRLRLAADSAESLEGWLAAFRQFGCTRVDPEVVEACEAEDGADETHFGGNLEANSYPPSPGFGMHGASPLRRTGSFVTNSL